MHHSLPFTLFIVENYFLQNLSIMKNILIIFTLLFATHIFNNLQAQVKIDLVNTTGGDGINEGDIVHKIHLSYFKALSKDDCEKTMTLQGTIEVIDIPETGTNTTSNQLGTSNFQKKHLSTKSRSRSQTSQSSSNTLSAGNTDKAYTKYSIPPTTGSTINFDNTEQQHLTKFGSRFYILFTFEDKDRCTRSNQPIDLNPDNEEYETLRLYVNTSTQEVRLATNGELTGTVVGGINEYFTLQGNLNAPANVEVGEIRMKITRKNKNEGPGNVKSNGG